MEPTAPVGGCAVLTARLRDRCWRFTGLLACGVLMPLAPCAHAQINPNVVNPGLQQQQQLQQLQQRQRLQEVQRAKPAPLIKVIDDNSDTPSNGSPADPQTPARP